MIQALVLSPVLSPCCLLKGIRWPLEPLERPDVHDCPPPTRLDGRNLMAAKAFPLHTVISLTLADFSYTVQSVMAVDRAVVGCSMVIANRVRSFMTRKKKSCRFVIYMVV